MNEQVYLVHHGIKGQKWGVRKYQNEDGTYTAAGRERYFKEGAAYKVGNAGNDNQRQRSYDSFKTLNGSSDSGKAAKAAASLYGHHLLTMNTDKKGLDQYAHNRAAGKNVLASAFKPVMGSALRDIGTSAGVGIVAGVIGGLGGLDGPSIGTYAATGVLAIKSLVRFGRSVRNTVQGYKEYKRERDSE